MADLKTIQSDREAKLRELTARVEAIDDKLGEPGDDDWDENAQESEGDEVSEKVGNIALAEIGQIKAALAQIDAGTVWSSWHLRGAGRRRTFEGAAVRKQVRQVRAQRGQA